MAIAPGVRYFVLFSSYFLEISLRAFWGFPLVLVVEILNDFPYGAHRFAAI